MVLLSTLLRFVQEGRSNRAAERLKARVSNTATVLRRASGEREAVDSVPTPAQAVVKGKATMLSAAAAVQREFPISQLMPGGHVVLSAGGMIPSDCRVMVAKDLFVSQSAMTGELLSVEKFADNIAPGSSVLDARNLLFMGTHVVSGSATALVVTTGNHTYFGALATRVTATDRTPTAFQAGVNSVSWLSSALRW